MERLKSTKIKAFDQTSLPSSAFSSNLSMSMAPSSAIHIFLSLLSLLSCAVKMKAVGRGGKSNGACKS